MIWKNLLSYTDEGLEEVEVNGERYLADPEYKPEAVVGQAFGADMDEGSYNQVLAEAVSDAQEFYDRDLGVFVQKEIAECLEEDIAEEAFVAGEAYKEDECSKAVSKYTTTEILELHRQEMENEGLDLGSVLYVGHPAHMERIEAVGNNVGLDGKAFVKSDVEWPSEDDQPWVRSPLHWGPREIAARSYRKIRGEM